MSNFTAKILLAASFLVLGGISAVSAQIGDGTIRVNIPNSFVLKDKTFPAGKYTIHRPYNNAVASSFLVLQGEHEAFFFDTIPTQSVNVAENTELAFEKVGDQYFLSKIWVKGETSGSAITRTKSEKRMIAEGRWKETADVSGH